MFATIVPLLLAATAPSPAERYEIETWVASVFEPYADAMDSVAVWDRPIYSAETAALIARWKEVRPQDELDGMNDGDWLCQCQDWDARAFKTTIVSVTMADAGTAEVVVSVDLGFGDFGGTRPERLILKREGGVWKLDDLIAQDFPQGIKQELRTTIAEDEAWIVDHS